jgi:hypothetical protein
MLNIDQAPVVVEGKNPKNLTEVELKLQELVQSKQNEVG